MLAEDGDTRARNALEQLASNEPPVKAPAPELPVRSMSRGLPTVGHWRGHPALGDVNGDGHLDLAASIRRIDTATPGQGLHIWHGDGGSSWTLQVPGIRRDMGYGGAELCDIDGDGKLDLGFSGHDVQPHLYLNFLDQDPPSWVSTAEQGLPVGEISADVGFGDFDRDGHIDVAVIGQFPQRAGLKVFFGDGTGSMARPLELLRETFYGAEVRMADVDGDGHVELLAATSLGPKVWSWDPAAAAAVDRSNGLPEPSVGGTDLSLDTCDLDGEGQLELVVIGGCYEGHPPIRVYRWNGEQWTDWGQGLPNDESYTDGEVADVIPGGAPEIVAAGRFGVTIVSMVAPATFERTGRLVGTEGTWHMATGDVDGDGKLEVVTSGFGGVRVLGL
jgi:hypothetical protein